MNQAQEPGKASAKHREAAPPLLSGDVGRTATSPPVFWEQSCNPKPGAPERHRRAVRQRPGGSYALPSHVLFAKRLREAGFGGGDHHGRFARAAVSVALCLIASLEHCQKMHSLELVSFESTSVLLHAFACRPKTLKQRK